MKYTAWILAMALCPFLHGSAVMAAEALPKAAAAPATALERIGLAAKVDEQYGLLCHAAAQADTADEDAGQRQAQPQPLQVAGHALEQDHVEHERQRRLQ